MLQESLHLERVWYPCFSLKEDWILSHGLLSVVWCVSGDEKRESCELYSTICILAICSLLIQRLLLCHVALVTCPEFALKNGAFWICSKKVAESHHPHQPKKFFFATLPFLLFSLFFLRISKANNFLFFSLSPLIIYYLWNLNCH